MKPPEPHHQLSLSLGGSSVGITPVRTTRSANKKRGKAIASLPALPIRERRFLPVVGVPKTRGDCPPPDVYCQHIRCRFHLALGDAEHRAGRPGLSKVPRDSRGWTMPVEGDLGEGRAGTTVEPRWLELERRCVVWTERDEQGAFAALHATYENEWDLFRERLHLGEAIDVLVDGMRAGGARLTPDGIGLDHEPSWFTATLERVRGVPSCALHEIDRIGKHNNEQAGDALGRHRTLIARELRSAVRKAIETGEEMGVDRLEMMGAIRTMGER